MTGSVSRPTTLGAAGALSPMMRSLTVSLISDNRSFNAPHGWQSDERKSNPIRSRSVVHDRRAGATSSRDRPTSSAVRAVRSRWGD